MKSSVIVDEIVQIVSEKIGREAICRKVKNRDEYFILDLAFSYFQKAERNTRNDYRSGYLYYKKGKINHLFFVIASPIMMSFFSKNFIYDEFKEIILKTSKYRDSNYLRYCLSLKGKEIIREQNIYDFIDELDNLEKSDFRKVVLKKNIHSATGIGNIFVLTLARNFNENDIKKIISKSFNLFLWLYPSNPLFKRNASLNRSLANKVVRNCEIRQIKFLPKSIFNEICSGQIEAAHIKPHKNGGSDKLSNGLWLCNKHHRLTEGKLSGKRSIEQIEVKYIK